MPGGGVSMKRLTLGEVFNLSDNVNVNVGNTMKTVPCWLCLEPLEIKTTKNAKKYTVCESCGSQCFVRRMAGMKRLDRLVENLRKEDFAFGQHAGSLFVIKGLLQEIEGLQGEIEKLTDKIGFFFLDKEVSRARTALEKRVGLLLSKLERFSKRPERENP